MIDLQLVVGIVVYLIVGALIFGLLYWLLGKVGEVCGPGSEPFIKVGRIILLILAVLVVIGILLSLVAGRPVFRWGELDNHPGLRANP